jgi:prophage tail gpP-like protein
MADEIVLLVNGRDYRGWKTIQIQQSLDNITGGFSLLVSDFFPGNMDEWKIKLGDTCEVQIDNDLKGIQTLITGYIDDINIVLM